MSAAAPDPQHPWCWSDDTVTEALPVHLAAQATT